MGFAFLHYLLRTTDWLCKYAQHVFFYIQFDQNLYRLEERNVTYWEMVLNVFKSSGPYQRRQVMNHVHVLVLARAAIAVEIIVWLLLVVDH